MELATITCPTCFEEFGVPSPGLSEVPCEVDYDCEICCRPMVVSFRADDSVVIAHARGLDDST